MARIRRVLVTGGAVLAGLFLATPNASAAFEYWAWQGEDGASYHIVSDRATVCDMEQDGHGVYGEFTANNVTHHVGDANGSASGCGSKTIPAVNSFRICEDTWGADTCSPWKKVP